MSPIKLGAIILILTAGLAGGYLIIKDSKTTGSGSYITLESSGKAPENSPKSPIQWMEKARDFISNPIESLGLNNKTDENISNNGAPFNLTEFVAKSVSNQMQTLDQKGVENIDPNDPKNQEIIEKAIASLQDPALFFEQTINDKDLKISNDNSKEAKIKYLEKIRAINQKYFGDPTQYKPADQLIKDISGNCFGNNSPQIDQLINVYQALIVDYSNTTIPSDWSSFHGKMTLHYKNNYLVYQAIKNCINDPIRGSLAIQSFTSLIEDAFNIQNSVIGKYKEVGLIK